MAISNLTGTQCKNARPGKHLIRLKDGVVKGFHLQVTPKGTKSWALAFTSPITKKRRFYPLGSYVEKKAQETDSCLTLASARIKAGQVRSLIDGGVDPIEKDKEDAEQARQAAIEASTGTTRQLFELYIENLEKDGKQRSADQIRMALIDGKKKDCESILSMKAKDVKKSHIAGIKARIAERGSEVQANRVRTYLHAAFNFGLTYMDEDRWHNKYVAGEIPDFGLDSNPVALIKRNARVEQPRKRYLDKSELVKVWQALNPDRFQSELSLVLKLLLSTGQRVEEVLQAEWSEFDFEDMLWRIPAERRKTRSKNPVDHLVPLTYFHLQLLEEVKTFSGDSPYLFPRRTGKDEEKAGPRGSDALSQAVYRFCRPSKESKRQPFEPFVPKDCRRTFKTLAGSIGIGLEMRNRLQGHAFQDVGSQHYDQWDYMDDKRTAMEKYCAWLDELIHGKKESNIVDFKGGAA